MSFNYKKVLVIGATSGIGEALAAKMVENGVKVIVVGRRKEKLDQFVEKYGKDKAEAIQFDITHLHKISKFAEQVMTSHPDVDSVFLNSGIQRAFDFSKPDTVNTDTLAEEITTNYTSYLYLTLAFLPYLQKQTNETSLIFTTSGLALVPMVRCANYCASKAALHVSYKTKRINLPILILSSPSSFVCESRLRLDQARSMSLRSSHQLSRPNCTMRSTSRILRMVVPLVCLSRTLRTRLGPDFQLAKTRFLLACPMVPLMAGSRSDRRCSMV